MGKILPCYWCCKVKPRGDLKIWPISETGRADKSRPIIYDFDYFYLFFFCKILFACIAGWLLCAILTVTKVLSDDVGDSNYAARTDIKTSVISSTPWFYLPYPGIIKLIDNEIYKQKVLLPEVFILNTCNKSLLSDKTEIILYITCTKNFMAYIIQFSPKC